ncbi:hypothetical protein F4776DRAFT_301121 [Hypoxylon sp. NC0597]|nr:hypothetical protein F4776DRAFT_301121 [Hypoxylon sp. NC0597]
MEPVGCNCASCGRRLGQFFNLWIKIGKSYISPVVGDGENLRASQTGRVRLGEEQTLIENCHLQDVSCPHCLATIGLRCLDTPVNHVLHNDQLFLRLSSVKITATNGDDPVQVTIQRTLKLKEVSRSGSATADTPPASESSAHTFSGNNGPSEIREQLLDHLQAQLDSQREEIQRLNRSGFQMVSSFDSVVLRVEGDIKKLRECMEGMQEELKTYRSSTASTNDDVTSLRDDLDKVKKASQVKSSSYSNIELELALAKKAIEDVRLSLSNYLNNSTKEQQEHQTITSGLDSVQLDLRHFRGELDRSRKNTTESISAAKASAREIASLRAELKELREELAQERSQKSPPTDPEFPSREIDILTTSITKIGQKASQVDTLQMEFELFKERLQRMEKTRTPNSQDAADVETQHRNSVRFTPRASRQKRKHSPQLEEALNLDASSATSSGKRPMRAPLSSTPSRSHNSINLTPPIQVEKSDGKASESPRLTKSGSIDKRYLKGSSRRGSRLAAVQDTKPNG